MKYSKMAKILQHMKSLEVYYSRHDEHHAKNHSSLCCLDQKTLLFYWPLIIYPSYPHYLFSFLSCLTRLILTCSLFRFLFSILFFLFFFFCLLSSVLPTFIFLVACTRLYKSPCRSVGRSVGPALLFIRVVTCSVACARLMAIGLVFFEGWLRNFRVD